MTTLPPLTVFPLAGLTFAMAGGACLRARNPLQSDLRQGCSWLSFPCSRASVDSQSLHEVIESSFLTVLGKVAATDNTSLE